ncbi:type II toxin-antitoxin system HigB family toxin [Phenylobacterium sp. LjRoot164]|uniref:type II toxin-antitoxin system HigB family toxin n=1 Tax=unclassified Phenylobacterium TaxID=2640670 RepID=UPI003ECE628D
MNVVALRTLQAFWARHPNAKGPLTTWYKLARAAEWSTPHDVRETFGSADFLTDNRVVFDVGGNNYRLVARISYPFKQVLVKFVGTHAEYDRIDATSV